MKAVILLGLLCPCLCLAQKYEAETVLVATKQPGEIDRSIQVYTQAITKDPTNPKKYYNRGVAEFQRSWFERQPMEDRSIDPSFQHYRDLAIADFSKTIELEPSNSEAFDQRGLAKEDYQANFQADFEEAIQLDPKNANAYLHKGLNDGSFQTDSVEDFTAAIRLDPTCAAAYFYRAEARQRMKNFEGTIEDLSKCIGLDPRMIMPYELRAYSEVEKGELAAAEGDWKKVTELQPHNAFWWGQLAAIRSRQSNFAGSALALDRAIKLAPRQGDYFIARGKVKQLQGDPQSALADYRAGLNFSPEFYEEAYTRFCIWECETQLGGAAAANNHLSHYIKTLGSPWGDWDTQIGKFLIGQSNESNLLAAAKEDAQINEAQIYIQAKRKIISDLSKAAKSSDL